MAEDTQPESAPEQNLVIQRIYVKDISFESPDSPQNFTQQWQPEVNIELSTEGQTLQNDNYEVILKVTVTAKNDDKTAFLAEVHQAGIFTLTGFDDEQRGHVLGSYCPNVLFPYIREAISEMIIRGGYPTIYLTPVNFDALYQEQQQQQNVAAQH